MKSIFITISAVIFLFIAKPAYTLNLSVGASVLGGGFIMNRGEDYKKLLDSFNPSDKFQKKAAFSFSPAFQANLILNFTSYFAMETGLGVGVSRSFHAASTINDHQITITRVDIIVPLMLRFQYSSKNIVLYTSIGPSLNMPTTEYPYTEEFDEKETVEFFRSLFTIDIGFAFGAEYMILKNHYVGIRAAYNLNVMPMFSMRGGIESTDKEYQTLDWNQDTLNISLTYRYAFEIS